MEDTNLRALSIKQPWASLIVNGYKRIENRNWPTKFRGPVLIHASKSIDKEARNDVALGIHPVTGDALRFDGMDFPTEGIIGIATIVDCISQSNDPWYVGPFGFVMEDARPLPFRPCRGMLGFFKPDAVWSEPEFFDRETV
jgi:hypothetical protein